MYSLVCATRPHQRVEKVVGLSFQPGLDPAKVTHPNLWFSPVSTKGI